MRKRAHFERIFVRKIKIMNTKVRRQSLGFVLEILTKSVVICVQFWLIALFALVAQAQVRPVYDQGALGLGQLLKRLNNTKSVLMIGAHPDDEDSGMLAYLARGENARTAYLSLTRGDGGQNRLGPELFEPLGIIRTEELLQARTLDGAEQYFTRAFDYGYSKTLAEAKSKWDEKVILCDVVRVIRSFRPLVVISRFSGTPRDGHGQHQFSGYISKPAVEAAADPNQCKNAGVPWKVKKFYRSFRGRNEKPSLRMNTGKYDPLLGRSYFQIAIQGRSQHKSQEQGFLELRGDRFSSVIAEEDYGEETNVFSGIDTTLIGFENSPQNPEYLSDTERDELKTVSKLLIKANKTYKPSEPEKLLPILVKAGSHFENLFKGFQRKESRNHELEGTLYLKFFELARAVKLAAGIKIDALANTETIAPGETFTTTVKVFYPKNSNIVFKKIDLHQRLYKPAWRITDGKASVDNSRFARFFRENPKQKKSFSVGIPESEKYTQPVFLMRPRSKNMYKEPELVEIDIACPGFCFPTNLIFPFLQTGLLAFADFEINGRNFRFMQPLEYRKRDQLRGELRRNLNIVPKVSLDLDQHLLIVPESSRSQKRTVSLNVLSNSSQKAAGKARLRVPNGWKVSPESVDLSLSRKGESTSYEFEVTIPSGAKSGSYKLEAGAEIDGRKFDQTMNVVAYDHIQTHRYYTMAETKVNVLDLKAAPVRVGYVMGSGDQIPEAIRQMGLDVKLLSKKDLTSNDFSEFDVIVIGIRASETRPDYIANNQRLLDWVKRGGTMIVQYQKFAYLRQKLAPFPAQYNVRVAEEDAKVTILEPAHPVFNFPNKITQNDFEGWVQERNLYAFRTFDERYTPLLESHDTGEKENKGGIVYARVGKGQFMYCSYSFFRQLPAGVPGAYRLFANILSLPKANRR